MELSLLLSALPEKSYHYPSHIEPADILDFRLLDQPQQAYYPNILYLGSADNLPELEKGMPLLNFFVYGSCKLPSSYDKYKVNLIFLSEDFSPLVIYDELRLLLEFSTPGTASMQNVPSELSLLASSQSIFLSNLLSAFQPQQNIIEHETARIKFRLNGHYYLGVIQPEQGHFSRELLQALSETFYSLNRNIQPFIYHLQLLLFFNFPVGTTIQPELLKSIREIALRFHVKIGLSNPFTSLVEIRRHYNQACRAISISEEAPKHTPYQPLFLYQELSYGELFSLCSSQADLRNYIYPPLMDLLEYDRVNDTHLMDTLFEYLQHNTNTKETAESMFMHKNTIIYRLNKIKEILQFDLSVGEDVFIIALSIRILIYLRIFIPEKVMGEYEAELSGKNIF